MNEEKKIYKIEIYDLECFVNFFSYTGKDIQTNEVKQFYIFEDVNQLLDLVFYIVKLACMIGFNNLAYDYPILHFILTHIKILQNLTSEELTAKLYEKSQEIIKAEYSTIKEKEVQIPQLDLYKIHHLDNKAKRASLKDIEIAMQFKRVEDLPFSYNHVVKYDEIEKILDYNLNDVEATLEFYKRSLEEIRLRQKISKKYTLPCINYSNTKIGSELLLKLYCIKTNKNIFEVRKLRTYRDFIVFKDIIFDYIKFNSKIFTNFLDKLKTKTISQTKNAFEESIIYKGFQYDYGLGGIHGSIKAGIYTSDDNHLIIDADVGSLYPSIAIVNKLYPKHLGEEFYQVYKEDIVDIRLAEKAKKELGDKAIVDGFKEAANASYGKSNEEYSWLYDPQYTMQTTINGQLMLTMLAEQLVDQIPNLLMIQINTDGLTVNIEKQYKPLYDTICKEWEQYTKLNLEFAEYSKMCIKDVNNYLSIYTNDKVKYKGCFEIDKFLYKNPSNRIVAKALSEYFVKGIPIKYTLLNNTNILDFCIRFKATYGWRSEVRKIIEDRIETVKCQKTNRYYISKSGGTYLKVHDDGREERIEANGSVVIYNNHEERDIKDYEIDYYYYIQECYKIINIVEDKQLELF